MRSQGSIPHQVVSASAGTGKTYRLTAHYLGLLHAGAAPQTIVATTFTRKAAGEILARVLSRLAGAALGEDRGAMEKLREDLGVAVDAARCRQMLAGLARNLHRAGIGTIDSFFHRMVRAFALELGVPAGVRVVAENDPLAQQLRWQALEAVLADGDLPDLLALLRWLLKDSAGHDVAKELDRAVSDFYEVYQEAPQGEAWRALQVPAGLLDPADLAHIADQLARLAEQPHGDKRVGKAIAGDCLRLSARDWPALMATGLCGRLAQGECTYYNKRLGQEVCDAYEPLTAHIRAVLVGQVARHGQAAWELLRRFDGHYRRLRREHRLLLFSDLAHLLARSAPELDDLYYRLDGRVQHLLLDEFQDTSRLQWRVLRPLAQEVTAHGDGQRSLFCVGDPKQAIYAWRGGCANLLEALGRELHLPQEAFSRLDTNYRSSPVVLDAVNRVFQSLPNDPVLDEFPQLADAWRRDFPVHKAHQRDLPGHVVLQTLCPAEKNDGNSAGEEAEDPEAGFPESVARYVLDLVHGHPGRSVGVLLRYNANLNRLIFLLRSLGLSVSGEGGNPLGDDSAVNLVLSVLRLADHPGDQPSAFPALESPLAPVLGLTSREAGAVDTAALAVRRQLIDEGYAAVISGWARAMAPCLDRRNAERLSQLMALADAYDTEPSLRPDLFARLIRETRVEEPTPAAVRIMTIHGAKGLEFDAVVLPELDGPLCRGGFGHFVQRGEDGQPEAVFAGASREVCELSPQLKQAHHAARAQEIQDELCALYVAMTRAKHALHMLVKPLGKRDDGGVTRDRACPSNLLRRALGDKNEDDMREQVLFESGDAQWDRRRGKPETARSLPAQPVRLRLRPATVTAPARRFWRRVAPSSLEDGGRIRIQRLVAVHDSPALRRGSLMHRWMSLVEWLDRGALPSDAELMDVARQEGWADSAVGESLAAFRQMLAAPSQGVGAALTRPAGEVELWRERRFAVRVGEDLLSGSFDRVVLHRREGRIRQAELWDFKTDRIATGADGPASRNAAVERYRPQLAAYRQALAVMLDLPATEITAKLLFLQTGDVCELCAES